MVEELVMQIRNGSTDYSQLWEQVRRFVVMMAFRRYEILADDAAVDVDDLIQAGFIGLTEAVKTYDPGEGSSFLSWFGNYLKRAFNVAAGRGWKRTARDPIHYALSLDVPVDEEDPDGPTLGDLQQAPDDVDAAAVESVYRQQLHAAEERLLSRLSPQGADVIRRLYFDGEALESIARDYGVTPAKMNSRRSSYLIQLRVYSRSKKEGLELRRFVDDNTNFYQMVGPDTFNRTHTSPVELLAMRRDDLRYIYLKEGVDSVHTNVDYTKADNHKTAAGQAESRQKTGGGKT